MHHGQTSPNCVSGLLPNYCGIPIKTLPVSSGNSAQITMDPLQNRSLSTWIYITGNYGTGMYFSRRVHTGSSMPQKNLQQKPRQSYGKHYMTAVETTSWKSASIDCLPKSISCRLHHHPGIIPTVMRTSSFSIYSGMIPPVCPSGIPTFHLS